MDERDDTPIPPLPIGDGLGVPTASTDAFRQVLRRHQRRQVQFLVGFLAAAVVAGSLAGLAISRGGGNGGTRVAAGNPPAASQPAGGSAAANPTATQAGVSGAASVGAPVGAIGKGPSTQLLVRDASDGTRVRLYEQSFPAPTIACSGNQACPQPAIACIPTGLLMAEVSDDQVAGQAVSPEWSAAPTTGLQPMAAEVIGGGQPQPILVVIAHAGSPVAKVTLTTPYGSDSMTPAGSGWVALAVRLPANYQGAASNDLPSGTLTALSSSGASVSSMAVQDIGTKVVPPACAVPPACEATTAQKPTTQPPTAQKPTTKPATGQTAPTQVMPCQPCPPPVLSPSHTSAPTPAGAPQTGTGATSSVVVACGLARGVAGASGGTSTGSPGSGASASSGSTSSAP